MTTLILAEDACAAFCDAMGAALGEVEIRCAQDLSALAATLASDDDAPTQVVLLLDSRDGDPGLFALDAQALRERVAAPLGAIARVCREVLSRWMEDGSEGLLALVLVHRSSRSATPGMLQDALTSLVRSVAKEHGRRGTRTLLVVADEDQAADAASALRLFLSPSAGLITGECVRLSRRGA